MKNALIIGTETATNGLESGASLRLRSIERLLSDGGYEVTIASRGEAKQFLSREWGIIALVSFSTAKFLRRARKKTKNLWFDSTDSWTLTRMSLAKMGRLEHLVLLARDLFWVWTAPKIDLITFITQRDAIQERSWWKDRSAPLIFPIKPLDRLVVNSHDSKLVFVGDGSYGPNVAALKFLEEVLNYLNDDTKVHLYGKNLSSSSPSFICHGYVPNDELYESSDIHLAPISSGGGLKLKVAVPLWNGLRVVATPEAANGFNIGPNLRVAPTVELFASEIRTLIEANSTIQPAPKDAIFEIDDSDRTYGWVTSREK
jgi:Glycosyl transferases group 1